MIGYSGALCFDTHCSSGAPMMPHALSLLCCEAAGREGRMRNVIRAYPSLPGPESREREGRGERGRERGMTV